MSELQFKYNLLDTASQIQVKDFIDFLIQKKNNTSVPEKVSYKKKILQVSVWSSEDINFLNEYSQKMNQWKVEEW